MRRSAGPGLPVASAKSHAFEPEHIEGMELLVADPSAQSLMREWLRENPGVQSEVVRRFLREVGAAHRSSFTSTRTELPSVWRH